MTRSIRVWRIERLHARVDLADDAAVPLHPTAAVEVLRSRRFLPRSAHTTGIRGFMATVWQTGAYRLQRLLRHCDIRTTTGIYGHLDVEDLRAALERLPELGPVRCDLSPGDEPLLVVTGASAVFAFAELHLHRWAECRRRTADDHQKARRRWTLALDELPDRADSVDDRGARRVGHELGEWLQRPGTAEVLGQREHVGHVWLEVGDGRLQDLRQALVEDGNGGRRLSPGRSKHEVGRVAGNTQRLETLAPPSRRHGIRDVDERLCGLADRDGRDDLVLERVDRRHGIAVLDADVDAGAVAGRPDPMRQLTDRDSRHQLEGVGAESEDFVQPANGDIGEAATRVADEVDVIRDRACVEHLQDVERRPAGEDHDLSDVLEGEPDLISLRCRGDVRAKGRLLLHPADDRVIGYRHHVGLRREARADVAVLAVRREDRHSRSVRQ